jgi:cell division protein FtsL
MTRVSSIFFWFGLTIVVSLGLYGTSNRVQELSKQLRALNAQIEAEQTNIHVLKAEWVYLANPERIEAAARKYLAMHPTSLKQIARMDDLPEILPTQKEAMAGVTVRGKPIASIGSTLTVRPVAAAAKHGKTSGQTSIETAYNLKSLSTTDTTHINTRMALPPQAAPYTAEESMNDDGNQFMLADTVPALPSGPAP